MLKFITVLFLVSCGSESKPETSVPSVVPETSAAPVQPTAPAAPAATLVKSTALPEGCKDHQLIYVTDLKEFQSCEGGIWSKIDLNDEVVPAHYERDGIGYIFVAGIQKARIAKMCPKGYKAASKETLETLMDLFKIQAKLNASFHKIVYSDKGEVATIQLELSSLYWHSAEQLKSVASIDLDGAGSIVCQMATIL